MEQTDLQRRRNYQSRDAWSRYANHRARVTELIAGAAGGERNKALAVLGAGNCNDIDLADITDLYTTICLVDIDGHAMRWGVERQQLSESGQLVLIEGDVAGLDRAATPAELQVQRPLSDAVDVVASVCMLSQLVEAASQINESETEQLQWIHAVRDRHCELLASMVKEHGTVLLISDFLSSDTCSALIGKTDTTSLKRVLRTALSQGNFFRGLHPGKLKQGLEQALGTAAGPSNVELSEPWIWQHVRRNYAVIGLAGKLEIRR